MRRSPPLIRDGTLAWPGAAGGHVVQVGTEAWSCWLEAPDTTSFRFEHQLGSFTARRERQAVADYWYAYRKYRGRLFKVYLGRSKDLTPRRLEEVASSLAARADLARGGGQITSAGDTAATGSGHVPQPIRRGPRIWQVTTEPTSFVGRQDEIAQALELLPSTRLLTLTGEGGIGKTRLAVRVAAATAQHYPEGVRLIDLASLKMPGDVARTIAAALGIRERADERLVSRIATALRTDRLLLVLDNCEHLAPAVADLADAILPACPGVTLLATSRVVLGCAAERVLRVPPLSLPTNVVTASPAELSRSEAVQLFMERGRSAVPELQFSSHNAALVARLCLHLDGIPLALELAAACLHVIDLASLVERVQDGLRPLEAMRRSAARHQRTLRATFEWSYGLLAPVERALFRRLSVFTGGWSLDAAETVCADRVVGKQDIVELLARLIDQSLVTVERDPHGCVRQRLLEPLRAFASERLRASGEAPGVALRHAAYMHAFAARAADGLVGPEQSSWLRRVEQELGNLRAALTWAERVDPRQGLEIVDFLWRFWDGRSHVVEGRAWAERMLACGNPSDGRAQAHGLRLVSYLARVQGDLNGAASAGEAYLALARQSGDPLELAWALSGLARTAWLRGHYERGRLLVTEALPRFEAAGQAVGTGWSYITLGQLAHHQGELAQARRHFEAAGAAFRRQGYPEGIGEVLYSLGLVDLDEGDLQQARARLQAALEIAEALNNELRVGEVRNRLGELSRRAGDLATARHQYQDSIVLARKSDDATGLASALAGMARVLVEEGERSTVWSVLDEALGLARAVDNTRFEARVLTSRGELERAEGRPGRAQHWHLQSLKLRRARGERIGMAENLVFLSVLALDHGNPRMAADLFSVADRLWAATGMQLSGSEATAAEHVRAVLGPLRLAQARAALASVSLDQLVDEVLAGGHIAAAAAPGTAQLTPREQEVLSEIAAGRTNREIAEDLVLSIRTVERHVASIYAKVGASGRAARALATAVALVGTVHGAAQADEMRAGTHPPRLGSP